MNIQEYLEKLQNIQRSILAILDCEEQNDENFNNLISNINEQMKENHYIFRSTLHLISNISTNHHQNHNFYEKIIRILASFKDEIKQSYSNHEIFTIFKSSKRILLFLFENGILIPDEYIASFISTKKYKNRSYPHYFYPEFKGLFNPTFSSKIKEEINSYIDESSELFQQQRIIGQNEAYVCELIRNDSLNEFISFCGKNRVRFNEKIDFSIFETNSFLSEKQPTMMEYAAFFGSIKIFKYLVSNEVDLKPSLWIYSIHGNNSEIIHFLEEKNILPHDKIRMEIVSEPYEECLIESVKCHHNDFANFIFNNYIISKEKFTLKFSLLNIKYFNYTNYSNYYQDAASLYLFCKIDEPYFVDFLLKNENIDINMDNIFNYNSNTIFFLSFNDIQIIKS